MILPKEFASIVTNSIVASRNRRTLAQFDPTKVLALSRAGAHGDLNLDSCGPYAVEIHPTSRCQLNCVSCSYASRNQNREDLAPEHVDSIHRFMRRFGARSLIYSGGGDPLAWSHDLAPLFERPEPFFRTIATNGFCLDRIIEPELLVNIDIIQVSLRGHTSSVFQRSANAAASAFERIERNIAHLMEMRQTALKFPQLTAKLIVTRNNSQDLPSLFRYCVELGFDTIVVKLSGNFEDGQDVALEHRDLVELHRATLDTIKQHPDYHYLDSIQFEPHRHHDIDDCWVVRLRTNMLVRSNGDVFLCIVSPSCDKNSIGNMNTQPVEEIWNGPRHLWMIDKLCGDMKNRRCNIEVCRLYRYNYILNKVNHVNVLSSRAKTMDAPKLL